MRTFEEEEIQNYMYLNQEIARLKHKKIVKRHEFYQQTFSSHVVFTGYEVISQGKRVETWVEHLDNLMRCIDRQLEIAEIKENYWQKFFKSLSCEEQTYFFLKYIKKQPQLNEPLDNRALEEIKEIQEAVMLQLGFQDEDTNKIELIANDYLSNLDLIINQLGGQ